LAGTSRGTDGGLRARGVVAAGAKRAGDVAANQLKDSRRLPLVEDRIDS